MLHAAGEFSSLSARPAEKIDSAGTLDGASRVLIQDPSVQRLPPHDLTGFIKAGLLSLQIGQRSPWEIAHIGCHRPPCSQRHIQASQGPSETQRKNT